MTVLIDREVPCEMRDGCVLKASVYRPYKDGRYPVLVFRTPYDKNAAGNQSMALDPVRMAEAGYVVVQQDTRGRWASQGVHSPWIDEYADGYDTIEWAARQPWSNGQVGAYGISYHGLTAWASAVGGPSALRAFAATQAPRDHYDVFWRGGAFELGMHLHWTVRVMGPSELLRARAGAPEPQRQAAFLRLVEEVDHFERLARTTPLRGLAAGDPDDPFFPYILDNFDHPDPDDYHSVRSVTGRYGGVKVPALITAGWHDILLRSDLRHYESLRAEGGSREAREETRLVIGPWTHGNGLHVSSGGEVDYGLRAAGLAMDLREDLTGYHKRWFDRWLKDTPDHGFAPVRLFVMGENRWRDEAGWPLSRATPTSWNLQPDGRIEPETAPPAQARALAFVNDPENPCPTLGGGTLMPPHYPRGSVEQDKLFSRPDVLVFTSKPLDAPLEVTGFVKAVLWASTSGRDADWVVKLCDVLPDGRSFNVCDGIVRASRRERGLTTSVQPGEIVRYEVDLLATAMMFGPGHRLRVMITSSDFPRYDRNPGTGEPSFVATRFETALHQIYCDADHPSHILLPIVPRA